MRKHESLRSAVVAAFPDLKRDPGDLAVWVEGGRIAARAGPAGARASIGFEWRYRLNLVLLDFVGDPNVLIRAVLDWLRIEQPDTLLSHTAGDEAIAFDVDVLDDRKVDIELKLELSEAVDIAADGAMTYRDEPALALPGFEDLDEVALLRSIDFGQGS